MSAPADAPARTPRPMRRGRVSGRALAVVLGLLAPALLPGRAASIQTDPAEAPGAAESAPGPFDSLYVALRAVANTNRNTFHRFWDPGPGVELGAEMPFYVGRVELGAQMMGFSARSEAQPDFVGRHIFAGWGLESGLPLGLRGYAGVRLGSFLTRFDVDDVPRETVNEQEIAWGLSSRLRRSVGSRWQAEASVRYRIVLTRQRIRHLFVAVGFARSFGTPEWLKNFLR